MLYARTTGGFYDAAIHTRIPADAVKITDQEYAALMKGQEEGKRIIANSSGHPILIDPPAPSAEEIARRVTLARSAAYRDEADPIFFKAQRGEATTDEWLAKVAEIKARFPDGVMPS